MKTALLILAMSSMLSAQPQSLGDVGRQERTRQKAANSKNTITNGTLGTNIEEEEPVPVPAAPATAPDKDGKDDKDKEKGADKNAADAKPADAKAAENKPRDETWWRDAFKQARADQKRAEDRSKVLQLELNQLNQDLLTRSDIFNREGQLTPQINAKNAELAKSEQDAEKARQKVTQLEDELRRSGAPAGWAR